MTPAERIADLQRQLAAERELKEFACDRITEARDHIDGLRKELEAAKELLREVYLTWPNIRQLIEGWKQGSMPTDEWSEFDEQVRAETERLSHLLIAFLEPVPKGADDAG